MDKVISSTGNASAVFNCQHDSADIVTWLVNSTSLSSLGTQSITECINTLPDGAQLHQLKIPAISEYNMTEIVCRALFLDCNSAPQMTDPVYLIFKGK